MRIASIFIFIVSFIYCFNSILWATIAEDFDIFELLEELVEVEILDSQELERNPLPIKFDHTVEEWVQATNNITTHLFEFPYNLIMRFSWKDIGDLGNYFACTEELRGIAQYYSLNVNITNIPFYFRSGMCMPVQWTQEMMDDVAVRLNEAFDAILSFLARFDELRIIDKYRIRFGYSFVEPRQALNAIREGKTVPAIAISILFAVFVILCIVATFLHTRKNPKFQKGQGNRSNMSKKKDTESGLLSNSIQHQEDDEWSISNESEYDNETTVADNTRPIRIRASSLKESEIDYLNPLDLKHKTDNSFLRNTARVKSKIYEGIKNVTNEICEIENLEKTKETKHPFYKIFSLRANIDFLYKPNTELKYGKANDLEIVNCIYCILTIWGLAISTPYYLLAAPLYNVWRFLFLFGQYLVAAVFAGHWVPELIILLSSFLGFVYFATKFEEVDRAVLKFLKLSGLVLLKKYIKYFILTIIATGFTFYISPFVIETASYYASGISYETCYQDWWWNLLMLGNLAPSGYYGMSGCLPWIWILSAVFQFWCVMPWIILLYSRSKILVYGLFSITSIFSIGYTMYLVYTNEFRVGVLAFENLKYNVIDKVIKSPLTKFHLLFMSFAFSRFYLTLQNHKKYSSEVQNKFMTLVYKRDSFLVTFGLWGVLLVTFVFYLLIGRGALINPYAWSIWENTLFYGFAKFLIYFVLFLLMFILFTDNSPWIKEVFKGKYFTVYSKLSLCVFLIYPTVIFFLYCSGSAGFYVSYPTVIYAAAHHFFVGYSLSFIITLFLIIPALKIINRIKIVMA